MLSRMALDAVSPVEVVLSIALLAASLPVALWVAARLYSTCVLMYGQTRRSVAGAAGPSTFG